MPTDTSVVRLAVDAGQTGIKLRLLAASDEVLSMPGVRTDQALLPQIADAVIATSRALGVRFDEIAVGTTGLSEAESDPERWLALCSLAGVSRVLLAHDSVTSYLGAMGRDEGVVVAAGTGVVTLGVGARTVARVDGWGNIMGDAGSGYWLGRGALDAVMRAYDGRGPATDLTAAVLPRYPNLETAYIELQGDPDRIAVTASFAKAASELARHRCGGSRAVPDGRAGARTVGCHSGATLRARREAAGLLDREHRPLHGGALGLRGCAAWAAAGRRAGRADRRWSRRCR